MIIGIAGKLGSGKDTVGSIIQYLTSEDVGPECIKRIRGGLSIEGHHNSSFQNKKFAGKLKQIASLLTGIDVKNFEDQEFKKTDLPNEWCYIENGYAARNMTVRDLLQKLGTEAMRDGLHKNVWVNALFADYANRDSNKEELIKISKEYGNEVINDDWSVLSIKDIKDRLPDYLYKQKSNWIITDMRFPNEMEAVKERGGITIRVIRDTTCPECGVSGGHKMYAHKDKSLTDLHPSETALDDAKFDYEIINDGSIEDLIEKVREILTKSGIL